MLHCIVLISCMYTGFVINITVHTPQKPQIKNVREEAISGDAWWYPELPETLELRTNQIGRVS